MAETSLSATENQALAPTQKEKLAVIRVISEKLSLDSEEKDLLSARLEPVLSENLQPPPPITAAKVAEGFRLSEDAPNLRKMYINLLATSMDSEKADLVRAGFAEIIQQLNPDEARVLTLFSAKPAIPVIDVVEVSINKDAERPLLLNFSLAGKEAECRSPQHIALYLGKLQRLGLIDKHVFTKGLNNRPFGYIDFDAMFEPVTETDEVKRAFGFDENFLQKAEQAYEKEHDEAVEYAKHNPVTDDYLDRKPFDEYVREVQEYRMKGHAYKDIFGNMSPAVRNYVMMLTEFGRAFCHYCLPIEDSNQDDPRLTPDWQPNANLEDFASNLAKNISSAAVNDFEKKTIRSLRTLR